MRLVFMGTPDFAVVTLAALLAAGHEVVRVYSQPPRQKGRWQARLPSPVAAFAGERGLAVATPVSLKAEAEAQALAALEADAAVVVAYGLLLPKAVLAAPRLGCFNVHASLLPRWRGAAPIQRAIMAGDGETGISIMRMDEGLDTGPVCAMARLAIAPGETAGELHDRLAALGARLMVETLARPALDCRPQPSEGVTYAAKIAKAEARIDFARPAAAVASHINGLSPFPGAWFEAGGARIKVLRALPDGRTGRPAEVLAGDGLCIACGEGAVRLLELQREGKSALSAADFLRGFPLAPGTGIG